MEQRFQIFDALRCWKFWEGLEFSFFITDFIMLQVNLKGVFQKSFVTQNKKLNSCLLSDPPQKTQQETRQPVLCNHTNFPFIYIFQLLGINLTKNWFRNMVMHIKVTNYNVVTDTNSGLALAPSTFTTSPYFNSWLFCGTIITVSEALFIYDISIWTKTILNNCEELCKSKM